MAHDERDLELSEMVVRAMEGDPSSFQEPISESDAEKCAQYIKIWSLLEDVGERERAVSKASGPRRRIILSRVAGVAAALVLGSALGVGLWSALGGGRNEIAKLRTDLNKANEAIGAQAARLDALARATPVDAPVGTVMAYAGRWPPLQVDGRRATEGELGWAVCDGRAFDQVPGVDPSRLALLARALGDARLPDYRGIFLRGNDPDGRHDPDGRVRALGSLQKDSLASHRHHVRLGGGEHTHAVSFAAAVEGQGGDTDNDPHGARQQNFNLQTTGPGGHVHDGFTDTEGGVGETRPVNRTVNYIIKLF